MNGESLIYSSVVLWDICSFNVAWLASFSKSIPIVSFKVSRPQKMISGPV